MTNRQIYTTKDAAVIYNISIRRARYLAQLRGIGTKVGGQLCFTWADIKALKPGKPGYPKGWPRRPMMDDGLGTGPIKLTAFSMRRADRDYGDGF